MDSMEIILNKRFEILKAEIKVKFSLVQGMKVKRGLGYNSTLSLALALGRMDGQRNTSASLPHGQRRGTHRTGGWVGSRPGLYNCGKSGTHRDSIPGSTNP